MEDGEERAEGIFTVRLPVKKAMPESPKPPLSGSLYPADKPPNCVPRYFPLLPHRASETALIKSEVIPL
jgi:hypothetical protein